MLTPQVLRSNARSKLQSAETLFAAGNLDEASYLAGYAVEVSLKARYCTRKGLSHFPADRKEAKSKGIAKLLTHDLDELLTLSESHRIRSGSMQNIDWSAVSDWSEQQRYSKIGTTTTKKAAAQIEETRKLVTELELFEIVEKMAAVEKSVSAEMGQFSLFALAENIDSKHLGWFILFSAWWIDSNATMEAISNKVRDSMDADLVENIGGWVCLCPSRPLIQGFTTFIDGLGHSGGTITKGNIIDLLELPPAYLITCRQVPRPDPSAGTP